MSYRNHADTHHDIPDHIRELAVRLAFRGQLKIPGEVRWHRIATPTNPDRPLYGVCLFCSWRDPLEIPCDRVHMPSLGLRDSVIEIRKVIFEAVSPDRHIIKVAECWLGQCPDCLTIFWASPATESCEISYTPRSAYFAS